jgi:hypothetical protein
MPLLDGPIGKVRRVTRIYIVLAVLALAACYPDLDALLPDEPPVWTGATFDYTGWGGVESPLLQGVLHITEVDSSQFTGTWEIHWAPGADSSQVVGPQVGSGVLHGVFTVGGYVGLDLSQGDSIGSVRLTAVPDAVGWHGRWGYLDSAGPRTGGAFTATLRP